LGREDGGGCHKNKEAATPKPATATGSSHFLDGLSHFNNWAK